MFDLEQFVLCASLTFNPSRFLVQSTISRVKERLGIIHQKELSVLESQPTNQTTGVRSFSNASIPSGNDNWEEVPESPPRHNASSADFADDVTLGQQEELDISGHIEESTSPPGSARINQVSHNGLYFDSFGKIRETAAASTPKASQNTQALRRTIFDRQNNARRVSPVDLDSLSQTSQSQPHPVASRKRQRSASRGESSDDAFEQDRRAVDDPAAKRRAHSAREERRVRQRTVEIDDGGAGDQLLQRQVASSQPAPSKPIMASTQTTTGQVSAAPIPSSAPAPPQTAPVPQTAWAQINSVPSSGVQPRIMLNHRVKWTPEEDKRLIMLIERWGPAWATIESQDALCPPAEGGPKFQPRQNLQVKLKDRARNLKKKYIRYEYARFSVIEYS